MLGELWSEVRIIEELVEGVCGMRKLVW